MNVKRVVLALPYTPMVILGWLLLTIGDAFECVGKYLNVKAQSIFVFLRNKTLDLNKKYGVKS